MAARDRHPHAAHRIRDLARLGSMLGRCPGYSDGSFILRSLLLLYDFRRRARMCLYLKHSHLLVESARVPFVAVANALVQPGLDVGAENHLADLPAHRLQGSELMHQVDAVPIRTMRSSACICQATQAHTDGFSSSPRRSLPVVCSFPL